MPVSKLIGKRDFIQHTSKYLKQVEETNEKLIITHQNKPALILMKINPKTAKSLRGLIKISVVGDINEHVLMGYEKW